MQDKRTRNIHLAASTLVPLSLLVSVSYTVMFRAVGQLGRYLTPVLAILFFTAGYFFMRLEERIFGFTRTDFHIDDGVSEETRRYVKKRYLVLPALISIIPAAAAIPLVDKEIRRLVDIGELDYYSDNFVAPWLVFAIIVISAVLGAAARMRPGNVTVNSFSVWFYTICHAAVFIIDLFMEIPSIIPGLMLTVVGIVSVLELNTACVEDLARKTGDLEGLARLRDTNFAHVKRIVVNFIRLFIVPFLLCAALSIFWQYALEHAFNQPL